MQIDSNAQKQKNIQNNTSIDFSRFLKSYDGIWKVYLEIMLKDGVRNHQKERIVFILRNFRE